MLFSILYLILRGLLRLTPFPEDGWDREVEILPASSGEGAPQEGRAPEAAPNGQWNVGYVTSINGNPAWIVPAGSAHTVDPRISSVEVSIGDVEMTFLGRLPVDDLIQYASTLRPA